MFDIVKETKSGLESLTKTTGLTIQVGVIVMIYVHMLLEN